MPQDVTARGYIWSQCALHLTSWPSCSLHLKTWPNSMTISNGLSLITYISKDLISCQWQFQMGGISESVLFIWQVDCFKWVLTDDIDQAILDLLALTVSCRGIYLNLYTSSENMNSFQVLALHHRGLFYKRPIKWQIHAICEKHANLWNMFIT